MLRMPYFGGVCGFDSMSILATRSLSLYSVAISSRIGAIILQGPHHSAQKSRRTGLSDLSTSWLNVASVVWTMSGLLTWKDLHGKRKCLGEQLLFGGGYWRGGAGAGRKPCSERDQTVRLRRSRMGLMSDEPGWSTKALVLRLWLGNERSASWAQFLMVPPADCKRHMR